MVLRATTDWFANRQQSEDVISAHAKKGRVTFIDRTEEMEGGGFQIIGVPAPKK